MLQISKNRHYIKTSGALDTELFHGCTTEYDKLRHDLSHHSMMENDIQMSCLAENCAHNADPSIQTYIQILSLVWCPKDKINKATTSSCAQTVHGNYSHTTRN